MHSEKGEAGTGSTDEVSAEAFPSGGWVGDRAQRPPGACPRASARAPRAPGLADPADGAGADAEATEPQAEEQRDERARRPQCCPVNERGKFGKMLKAAD